MEPADLADFVRRRSHELGLTQGELAARAGMSRQAVVKLLSGATSDPQISTIGRLARALDVAPMYLFRLLLKRSLIERPVQQLAREIDDHSAFVSDVTVPNGSIFRPSERFEKIWVIQNAGSVPWTERWLVCQNRDSANVKTLRPDCDRIQIPITKPGGVVTLAVWFTAPSVPCHVTSIWKMADAAGRLYFPKLDGLDCTISVVATL